MGDLHQAIGGVVNSHAAHVAIGTVRKKCARSQLDFVARIEQDLFRWRNFEAFQGWGVWRVGRGSLVNPCVENLVFLGIPFESLAAFVSDLRRGLEKNETLFRCFGISAAAKHVSCEGVEVQIGILTTERKPEACFAIGVTMTLAGVATGLGKHGHHVDTERNAPGRFGTGQQ